MYATLADMITRFGADELIQRTNRDVVPVTAEMLTIRAGAGDLSGFSEEEQAAIGKVAASVEESLADASSLIDPYLTRYTLPISPVPSLLKRLACDIARHQLYGDQDVKAVRQKFEDAMSLLRSVKGTAFLGPAPDQEASAPTVGGVEYCAPARVFSSDNLSSF